MMQLKVLLRVVSVGLGTVAGYPFFKSVFRRRATGSTAGLFAIAGVVL